jgi:Cu-Zn family superoxide dismutase
MSVVRPFTLTVALTLAVLACEAPPSPADGADDARPGAEAVPAGSLAVGDSLAAPDLPPDTVNVQGVSRALARVLPVGEGTASGRVSLTRVPGGVRVLAEVEGLTPGAFHALQILRGRDCEADPAAHLGADEGTPHGGPYSLPGLRHAGDLGSIRGEDDGASDGTGRYDRVDAVLSLDGTTSPVGRAVVLRALRDDASSPDGAAGDVIGCGVFEGAR